MEKRNGTLYHVSRRPSHADRRNFFAPGTIGEGIKGRSGVGGNTQKN
jgi:hypothetical protein